WYRVGGYHTSSRYKGKLLEAYYKLTFGRQDGARFVITIPTQSVVNSKEKPDQAFLDKMITAVEIVLDTMADAN
ncbi:exosortase-associated EpsI family protein, partial [Sedimenticola sp.]|uniref:exosortase-associated EpsI family protein n=1 Tax=Sedimenticola sp. TaxID=1940285 RepID=UPI003D12B335